MIPGLGRSPGGGQDNPLQYSCLENPHGQRSLASYSHGVEKCPTLSDPLDCSLPGSSVHGIFQARVLEWGAIAFSDTVEVRNRFKGLDLIECLMHYGWRFVTLYRRQELRLPVQVRCMIQPAQGWCTGMTQRDGMGREVGEGFRMGNTCIPMADSC